MRFLGSEVDSYTHKHSSSSKVFQSGEKRRRRPLIIPNNESSHELNSGVGEKAKAATRDPDADDDVFEFAKDASSYDQEEEEESQSDSQWASSRYGTSRYHEEFDESPQWVREESNELARVRAQMQDGFLDFKIFVRLTILELKLIIYPTIPTIKDIKESEHTNSFVPRHMNGDSLN